MVTGFRAASAVLLLMSLAIKLSAATPIHVNSIIRELKRLELQIARKKG